MYILVGQKETVFLDQSEKLKDSIQSRCVSETFRVMPSEISPKLGLKSVDHQTLEVTNQDKST